MNHCQRCARKIRKGSGGWHDTYGNICSFCYNHIDKWEQKTGALWLRELDRDSMEPNPINRVRA